jgi:hypothetical protein
MVMAKNVSRGNELLILALSVAIPGMVLAYVALLIAPASAPVEGINPTLAIAIPDTSAAGDVYVGARITLWNEGEEEPWIVMKPKEELPPVDLPPPVPSVAKPPTPIPLPGPRFEHAGNMPRWGEFPKKIEVPADAKK